MKMQITSSQFKHGDSIPALYTCEGKDISPPLYFINVPEEAQSLALIVDDPDAPKGTFVHWLVWNLPPTLTAITDALPKDAIQGTNDFHRASYGGPCPPSGTHRYFFKLYALDKTLDLDSKATKIKLAKAMQGHILQTAELIGTYQRRNIG